MSHKATIIELDPIANLAAIAPNCEISLTEHSEGFNLAVVGVVPPTFYELINSAMQALLDKFTVSYISQPYGVNVYIVI